MKFVLFPVDGSFKLGRIDFMVNEIGKEIFKVKAPFGQWVEENDKSAFTWQDAVRLAKTYNGWIFKMENARLRRVGKVA